MGAKELAVAERRAHDARDLPAADPAGEQLAAALELPAAAIVLDGERAPAGDDEREIPLHAGGRRVATCGSAHLSDVERRYDRIVLPAASDGGDGFTPDQTAWLLEHAPGEIVVLRPGA